MAEMQHSSHANKLWFIFANITTLCPICVQFTARSAFVITSLRPAYAKIYPATREDLGAETFFHAKQKSTLLKSVTSDDMITWFGVNGTNDELLPLPECQLKKAYYSTTTLQSSTLTENIETTSVPSFNPLPKVNIISVATYTINVDNSSITNLTDEKRSDIHYTTTQSTDATTGPLSTVQPTNVSHSDKMLEENIIPDSDSIKYYEEIITTINSQEENITITEATDEMNTESVTGISEILDKSSYSDIATEVSPSSFSVITTGSPSFTSLASNEKSTKPHDLLDNSIIVPNRHVNKEEIHNIPIRYDKQKGESEEKIPFAPEIKNDQYILLNKEALWGMLKEVVDDEFRKNVNSKILDAEKLRSH